MEATENIYSTAIPVRTTVSPYTDLRVKEHLVTRCKFTGSCEEQKNCKHFILNTRKERCTFDKYLLDICDYTSKSHENIIAFNKKEI